MNSFARLCFTVAFCGVSIIAFGQSKPKHPPKTPPQTPTPAPPKAPGTPALPPGMHLPPGFPGMGSKSAPENYDKVITKDAKIEKGMFQVDQVDDKVYFEIPKKLLNHDVFLYSELGSKPAAPDSISSTIGQSLTERIVRFVKHKNTIYLEAPDYSFRGASEDLHFREAMKLANTPPIIESFEVAAYNKDGAAVLNMTSFLRSPIVLGSANALLGAEGVDPSRSHLDSIKTFPKNIEVRSMLTFEKGRGGGSNPLFALLGLGGGAEAATVLIHTSFVDLPQKPMEGRLNDSRVQLFAHPFTLFGNGTNADKDEAFISRFKLVKKDPDAAVSDPVEPIVFYLSDEVPSKWRPWLKKGIEDWLPAFKAAGYSNAIVCKDAPTKKEDPSWDPDDDRYNVIRWVPSTVENAEGNSVQDPRSGQTLFAHVRVWSDVTKLIQDWYFVQVSPMDPRAQTIPMPTEVIGRALEYVICHEVGHTLGFPHNFRASSEYSIAQLRDPAWTNKWGDESSIMDYGRFNYVSQPGDGAFLIPKIGPYDYFALKYAYMPELAPTPEGEKPMLDRYLSQQVTNPLVRFGRQGDQTDPGVTSEDLGNDPIAASTLGFKNIDRVAGELLPDCTAYGESYKELSDMYKMLLFQRTLELNNVLRLVGGVREVDYHAGRGGNVYTPVSKTTQRNATVWLLNNALRFTQPLLNPQIIQKIQPSGSLDLVTADAKVILTSLFADSRLSRMLDNQFADPSGAYTVQQLNSDVERSIWREVGEAHPVISLQVQNLQNAYLDLMRTKLSDTSSASTTFRGIARYTLRDLKGKIDRALLRTDDISTKAHLMDARDMIQAILEGKFSAPVAAANPLYSLFGQIATQNFEPGEGPMLQMEGVNAP